MTTNGCDPRQEFYQCNCAYAAPVSLTRLPHGFCEPLPLFLIEKGNFKTTSIGWPEFRRVL